MFRDNISYGITKNTFLPIEELQSNTTYAMTVKAKDAAGNISDASIPLPVTTLENADTPGIGLKGEYFNNTKLNEPAALSRIDPRIPMSGIKDSYNYSCN